MANKLIVSLSPHVHSGDSVQKNMYGVIIALLPALLVSFYMFGLGAVIVTLTSVIARLPIDCAMTKYILKRERTTIMDGSAALTGILLAFNLPSNLPLYQVRAGCSFINAASAWQPHIFDTSCPSISAFFHLPLLLSSECSFRKAG